MTLDCTTITCAVEIIAEVGERLLVHNGVVIGVESERPAIAPRRRVSRRAAIRDVRDRALAELREQDLTARQLSIRLCADDAEKRDLIHLAIKQLIAAELVERCSADRYPSYRAKRAT